MDNKKGIILVVVLFLIAAAIFGRGLMQTASQNATKPGMTAQDVEKKVLEIQNDPHMPPQAKAIAIGQLRAHSRGGALSGGGGTPGAPAR